MNARSKAFVCVVAAHPAVTEEVRRALGGVPVEINLKGFKKAVGKVPAASVYILDSENTEVRATGVAETILHSDPHAKIIVLGESFTRSAGLQLLKSGVKGILTYQVVPQQIKRAVESVSFGGFWFPRELLGDFIRTYGRQSRELPAEVANEIFAPSGRERQILDALLSNQSNKEIANNLNISERTVKFHVSNLLRKAKVRRRTDLILMHYNENRKFRH